MGLSTLTTPIVEGLRSIFVPLAWFFAVLFALIALWIVVMAVKDRAGG